MYTVHCFTLNNATFFVGKNDSFANEITDMYSVSQNIYTPRFSRNNLNFYVYRIAILCIHCRVKHNNKRLLLNSENVYDTK